MTESKTNDQTPMDIDPVVIHAENTKQKKAAISGELQLPWVEKYRPKRCVK